MSGKRRKGFVTALVEPDPDRKLLPIEGVTGDIPSFDAHHLETLRWAATHYVSPLSVLLKRTIPPNVPTSADAMARTVLRDPAASRGRPEARYRIGSPPYDDAIAQDIDAMVADGRSVVVISPTMVEAAQIADHLASVYGERVVVASSGMTGADVTKSWVRIATETDTILVGTREVMLWPFGDIGLGVVVEDGRRVMRSPATPTLGVRDIMLHRSHSEAFPLVFHGPVPTLDAVGRGTAIDVPGHREWPMVEVVDKSEEPPSGAVLTERVKSAIKGAVRARKRVFVLVGSRGYAPAFRCVKCGDVRRCRECSSAASRDETCRRCGSALGPCGNCGAERFQPLGAGIGRIIDDISGFVGADVVGPVDEGKTVIVGSERDLVGVVDIGLAVAVDVDGITMAPHYRASEDGMRLLVRLAQTVTRGAGNRCVVQTSDPTQPVVEALVRGRSEEFLSVELASRQRLGFPPAGSLIAIETDDDPDVDSEIREAVGSSCTVLGPAPSGGRTRWLLQGHNLDHARIALRSVVSTLRGRGIRVRIDVDPIDL